MMTSIGELLGEKAAEMWSLADHGSVMDATWRSCALEMECMAEVLEEIADEAYARQGPRDMGSDPELSAAICYARNMYRRYAGISLAYHA